jgi:hypothetical protein
VVGYGIVEFQSPVVMDRGYASRPVRRHLSERCFAPRLYFLSALSSTRTVQVQAHPTTNAQASSTSAGPEADESADDQKDTFGDGAHTHPSTLVMQQSTYPTAHGDPTSSKDQLVLAWWNGALCARRLLAWPQDGESTVLEGLQILGIGLLIGGVIQFAIFQAYAPGIKDYGRLLDVPIFALVQGINVVVIAMILHGALVCLRIRVPLRVVSILTYIACAGALPLIVVLMTEQLNEALRLHDCYRDPALPYFQAATVRLLFPEQATVQATLRAWLFLIAEGGVLLHYCFLRLSKALASGFDEGTRARRRILIMLAIALTFAVDAYVVRPYVGRAYWATVSAILTTTK